MGFIGSLSSEQCKEFNAVLDNFKQLRPHVSQVQYSQLIDLYTAYGKQHLQDAVNICGLMDWKTVLELQIVAEMIEKHTYAVVHAKCIEAAELGWKSPGSLRGLLDGSQIPKRGSGYARTTQTEFTLEQAKAWHREHGPKGSLFGQCFRQSSNATKDRPLLTLKDEYR